MTESLDDSNPNPPMSVAGSSRCSRRSSARPWATSTPTSGTSSTGSSARRRPWSSGGSTTTPESTCARFAPRSPGASYALTERLSNLMALMKSPPPGVLSPLEQGMFALGYYHQLHDKFRAINERKAAAVAKRVGG